MDLRCLGAQGTRFEAKIGAPRLRAKSVIFEVSWVALSSPRAVPELSWLLWAAPGLQKSPQKSEGHRGHKSDGAVELEALQKSPRLGFSLLAPSECEVLGCHLTGLPRS